MNQEQRVRHPESLHRLFCGPPVVRPPAQLAGMKVRATWKKKARQSQAKTYRGIKQSGRVGNSTGSTTMDSKFSSVLRHFGYDAKQRPLTKYLPLKETLKSAKAAGLSVGDYIDSKQASGPRTPTDQTIDGMAALGIFDGRLERVCEIGPGSGRYLQKTIAKGRPGYYEVYETSVEWRDWLAKQYPIVVRKCDGRTLAETETCSISLVQSHKLFPALPFLMTVSYWEEMARVVEEGGWVVFDVMTEACFEARYLEAWLNANTWNWPWSPHLVGRDFVCKFFAERGISLVGSFPIPLYPAITECIVFRKKISHERGA